MFWSAKRKSTLCVTRTVLKFLRHCCFLDLIRSTPDCHSNARLESVRDRGTKSKRARFDLCCSWSFVLFFLLVLFFSFVCLFVCLFFFMFLLLACVVGVRVYLDCFCLFCACCLRKATACCRRPASDQSQNQHHTLPPSSPQNPAHGNCQSMSSAIERNLKSDKGSLRPAVS
jgi:hypothetical protein